MARKVMSCSASCHKLLSAAILLALLISSQSQTSLAELGGSASANGNVDLALGSNFNADSSSSSSSSLGSGSGSGSGSSSSSSGVHTSGSLGGLGGSFSLGGSSSASSSSTGSSGSSLSAGGSASASLSVTPKPEGLLGKLKDAVKSTVGLNGDRNSMQASGSAASGSSSILGSTSSGSSSASTSGSSSSSSSAQVSVNNQKGGLVEKIGGAIQKGKEIVKETARELKGEMLGGSSSSSSSSSSASGSVKISGGSSSGASANVQVGAGSRKDESIFAKIAHKASEFTREIAQTKENVRSKLQDTAEDKSIAVQVLDKAGEVAKRPVESVLKPIDKALGYQRDPLVKLYDESRELLRKPLSAIARPVEEVVGGAFKTSEESRKEAELKMNSQEKQNSKLAAERLKKGTGRSVLGEISDRTLELYQKPFEIILKPFDQALGLDKDGKKNPLLRIFDSIYGLSKRPVDAIAKPFENILKKMADGEQAYQVSVRFNPDASDPKLFTRLADGALNIADRILTKPIDLAMRPFGYGEKKKRKNPIVEAAHSLKNATKIGVELFTKPLDRIIKEIAEIGTIKNDAQREAELQRKRQEASRIVRAMDKFVQYAQVPWEFVLQPVGKVLGYNRDGRKEPLLQAWDVVHEVVRTPVQVITKPVEDAIFGEQKPQPLSPRDKQAVHYAAAIGGPKRNVFVQGIKKIERIAAKPIEMVTSPIRRLILGEDGKVYSKAGSGNDPIVRTIQNVNNVALKPLEILTQPISDIISPDGRSVSVKAGVNNGQKVEVKAQANVSQQKGQQASASVQTQVIG